MLQKDDWLSNYFSPKEAYCYQPKKSECNDFPPGFVYAKVAINDYNTLNHLLSQGFYIVETAVLFAQISEPQCLQAQSNFIIRETKESDRLQVLAIGSEAFQNARFYKDPNIGAQTSSIIKRDWVDNFYKGTRGTHLFVCEDKQGVIAGFLLMKNNTIDLIATAKTHAKQGVASSMIAFANQQLGRLQAGTQSTNAASIRLYIKNHFSLIETKFTLHRYQ